MERETTDYFADVIALAQATFKQVDHRTDMTPKRAILSLQGKYGSHRVFITELLTDKMRKYRYYVLRKNWVEIGFDNSPDPRAIRLKYSTIGKKHAGEHIPHVHHEDKTQMTLTEEMTFTSFVEWLKANIQHEDAEE